MTLKEHLEKCLASEEYKQTEKAFVRLESTEETLTFASIADILDSEASYLGMYFVSDDRDDDGILVFYITETRE